VSLTDYGAFVELEPGIEGLIHISEMTWNKRVKHPSKIVSVNEMVDVVILDIDTEARRISLGLKQTEPNPWDVMESRYTPGTVITGKVRNVTDFGVFVEVEDGIDGLVHVSDMSWTKRVKHPSELFKKGDEVQAVILSIDAANQKLSLGIKQLEPDRWEDWFSRHNVGDVVRSEERRVGKEWRARWWRGSSRRRHTRSKRDWSSDVCSSDLFRHVLDQAGQASLRALQEGR